MAVLCLLVRVNHPQFFVEAQKSAKYLNKPPEFDLMPRAGIHALHFTGRGEGHLREAERKADESILVKHDYESAKQRVLVYDRPDDFRLIFPRNE